MSKNSAFVLILFSSIMVHSCKSDGVTVDNQSLKEDEKVVAETKVESNLIPPGLDPHLGQDVESSFDSLARINRPTQRTPPNPPLNAPSNPESPIGHNRQNASELVETESTSQPTLKPIASKALPESIHAIWDRLLQQHVDFDGMVNYQGFIRDSMLLNEYLKTLSEFQVESLNKNDKIAFWINAYNAFTVKLIIQNYPLKSIMDLGNGKIWDKKWIALNQKTLSLNDIEHNILFKQYSDTRYHFALVCAAKSCPPLFNKAWRGHTLERDLQKRTQLFVQDTNFNQISENKISISKLFEWYSADFGDIIAYINRFQMIPVSDGASITFKEYDWDLNER
jgi:hypothetical protein